MSSFCSETVIKVEQHICKHRPVGATVRRMPILWPACIDLPPPLLCHTTDRVVDIVQIARLGHPVHMYADASVVCAAMRCTVDTEKTRFTGNIRKLPMMTPFTGCLRQGT